MSGITYTELDARGPEDLSCSVFRSYIDARVWMCNIPIVDVATGLVASTSLAKVKAYVEEIAERMLNFEQGEWVRVTEDGEVCWSYREVSDPQQDD